MNNKIRLSPEKKETPQEYFKSVLGKNSPDYLDLDRMVTETYSKISWENLKKYTKIENGKVEGIYWIGKLDLKGTNVTSLGKLKKVNGTLNLEGVTTLTDLGDLEEVGGDLNLMGTNITSLGKLKKVDGYLDLFGVLTLTDLGVLENVLGSLNLIGSNITSIGKLKKVDFGLYLYGIATLTDLSELSEVGGDLNLEGTNIKNLGKLSGVGGNLVLYGVATLTDLSELSEVGGDLNLRGTKIKSLGKLKKVSGDLFLSLIKTLTDLGELSEVGGNLDLKGTSLNFQLEIFKKIRENKLKVGESIYYDECLFSSKILELFNSQMIYGKPISFKYQDKESFKSIFGKEEGRDEDLQKACLEIAKEVINNYLESLEAKKQEYKEVPTIELKDEILKDYTEKKLFFEEMFGPRITGKIFSQFLKR